MNKSIFSKGMEVRKINHVANNEWKKLNDCLVYLNEDGKAALETFSIIEDKCTWVETTEELKRELSDYSIYLETRKGFESNSKNKKIVRNLKNFIKNYL